MKRENIVMFIWECLISAFMDMKRKKVAAIIWACIVFTLIFFLLVSLNGEMSEESEERWVRIGF